ncbi:MAG: nucleotidyltransferase family protein [Flavobacteriales bacterium]|nr:nucleotidyltransferase family protein [Flavobacteriales bacterium]
MNEFQNINTLLQLCKSYLQKEDLVINEGILRNESLLTLAKQHRVTMPLAPYFSKIFEAGDAKNQKSLKEFNERIRLNMLKFTQESLQLLQLFDRQNLFCFCLKGPIGAKQIFDDYTAKDSRDIDVLIDESKIEAYIDIIQERGYAPIFDFQQLNTKQKNYFKKVNNQLAFFHKEKKIMLEIHWRLFANDNLLSLSYEELKSKSQTVSIANHSVNTFSDEHLLFYLIAHGAKHKWSKLYWLLEISVLIQKTEFNWLSVVKKAQKLHLERMLFQAFILIQELFNIAPPVNILRSRKINQLVNEVKSDIFNRNNSSYQKSIKNYWSILKYKMKLKSDISYKLNYFNFISIQDFKTLPMPEQLFGLYYICRPFLWTRRYLIKKAG